MVINSLKGKVIFLDTAPLIYYIEPHTSYHQKLSKLFLANDKGLFTFVTSTITLLEVLVRPIREGMSLIVEQYKHILFESPGIEIVSIDSDVAITAARLRARHNLKTPDALQLAVAIERKANYFLTNDLALKGVTEIKVITPENI